MSLSKESTHHNKIQKDRKDKNNKNNFKEVS